MPWGAAVGAVVGAVANNALSDGSSSLPAGATSSTKQPWAPATPWLLQNMAAGQRLQDQYAASPFSPAQQAAYANQYGQSDYMRRLIPSLLGQMGQQQVGFDRSNPTARPQGFNWAGLLGASPGSASGGLTGAAPNLGQTQLAGLPTTSVAPPAAAPANQGVGTFVQQETPNFGTLGNVNATPSWASARGSPADPTGLGSGYVPTDSGQMSGSYGQFRYGMDAPAPGTKAYRDMQEYFAYGGSDPFNLYGRAPQAGGGGLLRNDGGT